MRRLTEKCDQTGEADPLRFSDIVNSIRNVLERPRGQKISVKSHRNGWCNLLQILSVVNNEELSFRNLNFRLDLILGLAYGDFAV